ncbi:Fanconi anemia core complex-associated protein 20 [Centropristis striata]|uniref:Fanconi anemia core complex-associated protein 20 n=1 Tax=Centropristis striata TaxID=184440 RepID=UPI0027DEE6C9|nr:Fanconi anemia core complex-associated protein 20 [Centropristis striata]
MAEKYSKSKLKRNKSFVKDFQPESCSRGTVTGRTTLLSSESRAEAGRSVWWNSEQLPAVERLWALTLKSALPYLENQHWDLAPDLPHPSTARPTALKLDEQRWCDLREEVAPFPEPSLRPSWSLSSCQQEPSAETRPEPEPPDRQLSPTTSLQAVTKRPRQSLYSWEGPASSAGPSSVGGDKGRKAEETRPGNRQPLTNWVKVSDSRVSPQREAEHKEEVQEHVGAAGRLQSCPMCLLLFPVGFTQMDCDSHLAQCLSEVNVDMTW